MYFFCQPKKKPILEKQSKNQLIYRKKLKKMDLRKCTQMKARQYGRNNVAHSSFYIYLPNFPRRDNVHLFLGFKYLKCLCLGNNSGWILLHKIAFFIQRNNPFVSIIEHIDIISVNRRIYLRWFTHEFV